MKRAGPGAHQHGWGTPLPAAAKFLCHEREVFPAQVRPQIFPRSQSNRLAQRPSQLGVEARHVRWQVHWRGQARDIMFSPRLANTKQLPSKKLENTKQLPSKY